MIVDVHPHAFPPHFIAARARPPAFVDGHQHAHALPGIRDLVLTETALRAPEAWIRDCADRLTAMLARPFAGKAIDVSRIEKGWGSFEGEFSKNLRVPIDDVPEQYREAFISVIGRQLKQAAGAEIGRAHV